MFGSERDRKVRKIGQTLEQGLDVEVLELLDDQAKHIILGGLQLLDNLLLSSFIQLLVRARKALEQFLNMAFNVGLLETAAVQLFLDVLEFFHALFLPVELVVDVVCRRRDWQITVCQFNNLLCYLRIVHTLQFWELMEVQGYLLVRQLHKGFDFIAREGRFLLLFGFDNRLGDVVAVEHLCTGFGFFLLARRLLGGRYLLR